MKIRFEVIFIWTFILKLPTFKVASLNILSMFQQTDVSQDATCITKGGSLLTVTLQYHIKPKLQIKNWSYEKKYETGHTPDGYTGISKVHDGSLFTVQLQNRSWQRKLRA